MEHHAIFFIDDITGYDFTAYPDNTVHALCLKGNMSFSAWRTRFNVSKGDYAILPTGIVAGDILQSDDCSLITMSFNGAVTSKCGIRNDYGVIGHLSLLQNPVLRLDDKDFKKCREDIYRIRERVSETGHLFYDEMITSILKTHILDLYDIHARNNRDIMTNSRPAALMRRFIGMLVDGDYETDRTLEHYSSRLCITPHYLSEISQMLSCRPATYWIDRFVINEISRLLVHKELSLTDIAERLNFSSVSYLSRYVSKHLGIYPSAYRKALK